MVRVVVGCCGLVLTAVLLCAARFTCTAARVTAGVTLRAGAAERVVVERVVVERVVLGRAVLGRD